MKKPDEPLERKVTDNNLAVYGRSINTNNPNVKRTRGAQTIVPVGSSQDNALNQTDASAPTDNNNRYTFLMKNTPKGDEDAGT